ncbi:MAG: hypothetical protein H6Q66_352 [Firmicutes bacterium]|nr:hypothetical protein [Bacillota bacterium]
MNEIGGYFSLEELVSSEYHQDLLALNNARNCLLYLLKAQNIEKVYIPYFNCDSVSDMCQRNGYEYEYYPINADFMPVFEKKISSTQRLYIINYYGRISNETIGIFKEKYKHIIIDNAQAFFQKPVEGIDTLYSCRKFFGVPDGGYLSTDARLEENLATDTSGKRMKHLLGRYEGPAANFHVDFKKNDEAFKGEPLKTMSKLTHNLLGAIDYKRVCDIRNRNYRFLAEQFDGMNRLKPVDPCGAFAYPFYAENASEIKKKLAQKNIYIPTLWPNVLNQMPKDSVEYDYSANILPLPCDQRCTMEDMQYIAEELKKCDEKSKCVDLPRGV